MPLLRQKGPTVQLLRRRDPPYGQPHRTPARPVHEEPLDTDRNLGRADLRLDRQHWLNVKPWVVRKKIESPLWEGH
eukprot:5925172-Pleurochrysis_carterae.AAC.4